MKNKINNPPVHFGAWLKSRIRESKTPILQFARKIDVDGATLHRWFKQPVPTMRDYNLVAVAQALGFAPEHVRSILLEAMRDDPKMQARWIAQAKELEGANTFDEQLCAIEKMKKKGLWEEEDEAVTQANIDRRTEVKITEVPTFDLAVAAGPWTEVAQVGELHDPALIDAGRFRIKIRGDSMEPKFKSGETLEFLCLREGETPMETGKEYYVQVGDEATFKRLAKITEEELIFKAINSQKYPQAMRVRRAQILRMAKATARVEIL
jgi:SOS-response transcriptional repressor LexA